MSGVDQGMLPMPCNICSLNALMAVFNTGVIPGIIHLTARALPCPSAILSYWGENFTAVCSSDMFPVRSDIFAQTGEPTSH